MSAFVDAGIAKVLAVREDIANAHPAEVAKAVFEHVEEWLGAALKAPPPAPPGKGKT